MDGIAEKAIQFEDTGDFTVEIVFYSSGIFAGVSSSDNDIDYEVRVVSYAILVLDNIQTILISLAISGVISVPLVLSRTLIPASRSSLRITSISFLKRGSPPLKNIHGTPSSPK